MSANRVADLSIEEFKALIRETVREALHELEQERDTVDAEDRIRPAVVDQLQAYLKERPKGRPAADVHRDLGLDV